MTKARHIPIESFGHEIFNALIEGSKRKIEIATNYQMAVKLRLRIYQLRHRLREEKHPLYSVTAKTRVSIAWSPDTLLVSPKKGMQWPRDPLTPVIVTISPHDSQFSSILAAAGVDVHTPLDPDLLKPIGKTEVEDEPLPTIEDLLKDFK